MIDFAKIAYEVWAAHQGWKDGDFDDIPLWKDVPQEIKDAWDAAACAVLDAQPLSDTP